MPSNNLTPEGLAAGQRRDEQLRALRNRAVLRIAFYALATEAITAGLLTAAERDIICRPGSRKSGYWARHLRDLRGLLAERLAA
jgi:hypothetical protein